MKSVADCLHPRQFGRNNGGPFAENGSDWHTWRSLCIKRVVDIVVSVTLLAVTAPLIAIFVLLVRLESKGGAVYKQERVGLGGNPFVILKLRSMRCDAEVGGTPQWAQQRDPRVTRIGTFIRKTRIDELPQLINVLRGDMSVVGPRPERPHFVEQLAEVLPFYRQRTDVRPGITGWAQTNLPYGASVEEAREKLAYDLYYVKHRSFFFDLNILFMTFWIVCLCRGGR
jgi:exopolysaccharide biosynthesis polyprenyl glycosylphosphotransferase